MLLPSKIVLSTVLFVNISFVYLISINENQFEITYVKWIVNELLKLSKINSLKCVTVATLNFNYLQSDFQNLLFREISSLHFLKIVHQSDFLIEIKNRAFCDIQIVIETKLSSLFMNIRKFSNLNKSAFFIVLFPLTGIGFNSINWDVNAFTHERVFIVNNFTIYQLESPYQTDERKFVVVSSFFDDRKVYSNFGGKHLKAAAMDCSPHNYLRKNEKTITLDPGVKEIICNPRYDNQQNCSLYFP